MKYIISYKDQIVSVESKSSSVINKKIRQDWEMNQQTDSDSFKSFGLSIAFQDYSNGLVSVLELEEWFEINKNK